MKGPSYLKRFARQTIKVDGTDVEVFIMGKGSSLPIGADLSEEMDRVSAQLAYWSAVAAEAKRDVIRVDAHYRRFRAIASNAALEATANLAEWKVKARVESTDGFIQHKEAVALSEKHLVLCNGMVMAFDKKANQLQSIGAKRRSEMGAQGMTTPERPKKRGWNLSGNGSEKDDEPSEPLPDGSEPAASSAAERDQRMTEIIAKRERDKKQSANKNKTKKKATKKKRAAKKRSK